MKFKLIFVNAVAAFVILLAACTPQSPQSIKYMVDCDPFMEVKHIGLPAEVAVSDTMIVVLCSNPTTGFKWSESAEIADPTIMEQIDHKYIPPEAEENVGGGGKETWTFRALKRGSTTAFMEYSQPWDGGVKKEWTFVLQVTVK